MANVKDIYLPFQTAGITTNYMKIRRALDGFYLDDVDGDFRATPATPNISLAVVASLPSVYYRSESRKVWNDGEYNIFGYDVANTLICGATLFIMDDKELTEKTIMDYEGGNWELVGNRWVYYDTDGTTILRQFNVFDASHNPSMTSIYKREKI
jgi:hypothetical protein